MQASGHHRAACIHSMMDSRWCKICECNIGHVTVNCLDYMDYSTYAQWVESENRDEDPTPQDNLQPSHDSTSSFPMSTTSVASTLNTLTLVSTLPSSASTSTTSTSSSVSTQSSMASTLAAPVSATSTQVSSPLNSVALVPSVFSCFHCYCGFISHCVSYSLHSHHIKCGCTLISICLTSGHFSTRFFYLGYCVK